MELRIWMLGAVVSSLGSVLSLQGASINEGESVVVVFNQNVPESESVAKHYATKRQIPEAQVFGLDLPEDESISRLIFREKLQYPLLEKFRRERWFEFDYKVVPATHERVGQVIRKIKKSSVRYLTLCYGVPLRIQPDATHEEEGKDGIRIELRRNEAAIDSELAVLPIDAKIYGPVANPAYRAINSVSIRPEMGILMVGRLDGPSHEIAKRLVDQAIQAEEDGLWGRAYFDIRGIGSSEYKLGDDWIARAADFSRQMGFEIYVDRESETFPQSLPLSHVGLYAGWYDVHVSGPFRASGVEFMPGAIAYHLHSFSAQTIRSKTAHWVGPLLEAGATATMGCVYEPYLALTPNLEVFFARLFQGYSFGEAAYASQQAVSWQTTVVGDPLYRPFGKPLPMLQAELQQKKSSLTEWLGLMNINRAIVNNTPLEEVFRVVKGDVESQMSSILTEKLGDLHHDRKESDEAIEHYRRALQLNPSSQQDIRIRLRLAALYQAKGAGAEAILVYLNLVDRHPDYIGRVEVLENARVLATKLDLKDQLREIEQYLPSQPAAETAK